MSIQAYQYPVFTPAMRLVIAISNGYPCSVQTSFPHGYVNGTMLRLAIPLGFGMQEANQKFGSIYVTGADTFNLDVDTTNFSTFTFPAHKPFSYQYAQCVPFGEIAHTLKAALRNQLPITLL